MENFGPWIPAQKQLPRNGDIVLVCCEDGTYLLAAYDEGWREPWEGPLDDVVCWCVGANPLNYQENSRFWTHFTE